MLRLLFFVLALLVSPLSLAAQVNVNTASAAELDSLPGIGPSKAQAIVTFREQQGPFSSVDSLVNVPGIGPATLLNIQALVTIDGSSAPPTPDAQSDQVEPTAAPPASGPPTTSININTASASALQAFPGVGATKAAAIVADRDEQGPFTSCQDLTRVAGFGPATVANVAPLCTVK